MNRKYTTQISALLMSAALTAASCPPPAYVKAADQDLRGKIGKYAYEMWNQNYAGEVKFTPEKDGTLKLKASGTENILLTKGTEFESRIKHKLFGKITASYDIDFSFSDLETGNAQFGIYGWAESPITEYYIVEGWRNWRPPGSVKEAETVEIDGALYDIYITYRNTMGGIQGTTGYPTYWSVRRENRIDSAFGNISGTVTVSEHFKVWEKYGFNPESTLYNTTIAAEAYRCSPFSVTINGCEILTEYSEKEITKIQPAETVVTDPEPEITEPEDMDAPEITDVPETEPAVTEPAVPEENPAVTDPAVPEENPAVTDPTVPEEKPAVTDPTAPEENPAVTDSDTQEESPAVTDPSTSAEPEITDPDKPDPQSAESEIIPGDTDGNGTVNCADLITMKRKLLYSDGKHKITPFDLNKDRKINIVDFILLKNTIMSEGR